MPVVACTPYVPVSGVAQFSLTEFLTAYPEFTGINAASLANDFTGATFLLNNTCCSQVADANQRLYLLYLLTAHIAAIFQGVNDAGIGSPAFSGTVSISGTTAYVSAVNSGALAVGSVLYDGPSVGGSLVTPGTTISAFISGSGGIGSYNVNVSYSTPIGYETMIVAGTPNVQAPLGIVGRVNSASEGDVSVSSEWQAPPNANQAYFTQTKYGAQYWTATARFRTAQFVPAPPSAYDPLYGLGPWGGYYPGNGYNGGGGYGC